MNSLFSKAKALFMAAIGAAAVTPIVKTPALVLRRTAELQHFGNTDVPLVFVEWKHPTPLIPGGRSRTSGIPWPGRTAARSMRTSGARFNQRIKS